MPLLDPVERAVAAATHARMLLFRERSIDEVSEDLRGLSELTDPDELETVYECAIEMLAMLDPDELQRLATAVAERRGIERRAAS